MSVPNLLLCLFADDSGSEFRASEHEEEELEESEESEDLSSEAEEAAELGHARPAPVPANANAVVAVEDNEDVVIVEATAKPPPKVKQSTMATFFAKVPAPPRGVPCPVPPHNAAASAADPAVPVATAAKTDRLPLRQVIGAHKRTALTNAEKAGLVKKRRRFYSSSTPPSAAGRYRL